MKDPKLSEAARELGKKGGPANYKKHGREHMIELGKLSGKSRRNKKEALKSR